MTDAASFYSKAYRHENYCTFETPDQHYAFTALNEFVVNYHLSDKKCLEVGSGRGAFQNVVDDYTGIDLSDSVAHYYQKPFHAGSAEDLPFEDETFDAIWSITALEHIPNPDQAMCEMRRVLKRGGIIYLKPAWNCRPWICEGIPARPYSDLNFRQRLVKLSLPVRDSVAFIAAHTLPRRLFVTFKNFVTRGEQLRYQKLKADYETFWMVDSDACSCIDPFDAIQWFRNMGDEVLSHPTWRSAFLSRSEPLIVRVQK